jgi:hypothetical protein
MIHGIHIEVLLACGYAAGRVHSRGGNVRVSGRARLADAWRAALAHRPGRFEILDFLFGTVAKNG